MKRRDQAILAAPFSSALVFAQGSPGFADPIGWAPAWGWRAKHHDDDNDFHRGHHHHLHRYDQPDAVVITQPSAVMQPSHVNVPEADIGSCHGELLGTVVGPGVGAAAGSQIGKRNGQIATVIAGTVTGGLVGGSVGRSMDQADAQCLGQAMEHAQTGQTIAWRDPTQDADYRVTPTRTYQGRDGRYCREFTEAAVIGGQKQQVYGTACRQRDGSWQIQN